MRAWSILFSLLFISKTGQPVWQVNLTGTFCIFWEFINFNEYFTDVRKLFDYQFYVHTDRSFLAYAMKMLGRELADNANRDYTNDEIRASKTSCSKVS